MITFYAGAPEYLAGAEDWSEASLYDALLPPFTEHASPSLTQGESSPSTSRANWRQVSIPGIAGHDKNTTGDPEPTFHPLSTFASLEDPTFIDHTLAAFDDLDNIQTSQLAAHPDSQSTFSGRTSFSDPPSGDVSLSDISLSLGSPSFTSTPFLPRTLPAPPSAAVFPAFSLPITALASLLSAPALLRLRPQTVTINLIAGVIDISAPRTVHIRRGGGYAMQIQEVLLGDETRAGFGVSAWLVPEPDSIHNNTKPAAAAGAAGAGAKDGLLRADLAALRRGDVVHVSHLALTAYRGQVYGQTLSMRSRRPGGGVSTRFSKVPDNLAGVGACPAEVVAKVGRVRDWVAHFVSVPGRPGGNAGSKRGLEQEGSKAGGKRARTRDLREDESELPPDSPW